MMPFRIPYSIAAIPKAIFAGWLVSFGLAALHIYAKAAIGGVYSSHSLQIEGRQSWIRLRFTGS
jgi:hypothetical protein